MDRHRHRLIRKWAEAQLVRPHPRVRVLQAPECTLEGRPLPPSLDPVLLNLHHPQFLNSINLARTRRHLSNRCKGWRRLRWADNNFRDSHCKPLSRQHPVCNPLKDLHLVKLDLDRRGLPRFQGHLLGLHLRNTVSSLSFLSSKVKVLINIAFTAPGDRSHIPDHARPIFEVLSDHVNRMKQATPPQQKRIVDDLERRIGSLFDSLNCETLSDSVVDQLLVLVKGECCKVMTCWGSWLTCTIFHSDGCT